VVYTYHTGIYTLNTKQEEDRINTLNALLQYFVSRPWVAASEKFLIYPFPQGQNGNGLDKISNFPMINSKEVDLLFPRY
jgi:hypothetical protein